MAVARTASVSDVLIWLSRVWKDEASRLLVGCALDDDLGADEVPIAAVDGERKAVMLQDGRRVLLQKVRSGEIVDPRPDSPLLAAITAARTLFEVREARSGWNSGGGVSTRTSWHPGMTDGRCLSCFALTRWASCRRIRRGTRSIWR